ncbi:hypothetical protein DCM91_11365 [Chitinophaga costaii]|nr:hypothetical protein [Chitinophaga costaii]PUZ24686.1 hypothetical protein DCM91_11365 [Chitinophaga costaii]
MKKLFVLALAGGMFAACNSGNGSTSSDSTTVKTDSVTTVAPAADSAAVPAADSLKVDSAVTAAVDTVKTKVEVKTEKKEVKK